MANASQIIIYQTDAGETTLEVRLENETVWLTQKLMAELFQTTPQNITMHLKNIFEEGELEEDWLWRRHSHLSLTNESEMVSKNLALDDNYIK